MQLISSRSSIVGSLLLRLPILLLVFSPLMAQRTADIVALGTLTLYPIKYRPSMSYGYTFAGSLSAGIANFSCTLTNIVVRNFRRGRRSKSKWQTYHIRSLVVSKQHE